jgi:hypothetical protein
MRVECRRVGIEWKNKVKVEKVVHEDAKRRDHLAMGEIRKLILYI